MCEFFQILLDSQPPAEQHVPVTVGVDRAVAALFEADRDVLLRIQLDPFGAVVADPGNEGDVVAFRSGPCVPAGRGWFRFVHSSWFVPSLSGAQYTAKRVWRQPTLRRVRHFAGYWVPILS